jgi:hypothetical protein
MSCYLLLTFSQNILPQVASNIAAFFGSNNYIMFLLFFSLHLSSGLMGATTVVHSSIAGDRKPHVEVNSGTC